MAKTKLAPDPVELVIKISKADEKRWDQVRTDIRNTIAKRKVSASPIERVAWEELEKRPVTDYAILSYLLGLHEEGKKKPVKSKRVPQSEMVLADEVKLPKMDLLPDPTKVPGIVSKTGTGFKIDGQPVTPDVFAKAGRQKLVPKEELDDE